MKLAILQKERLVCSIDVINLGISESNMLAEVGNKALWHNYDALDQKLYSCKKSRVFRKQCVSRNW